MRRLIAGGIFTSVLFLGLITWSPHHASASEFEVYIVQPGDVLWSIALEYNTDVQTLVRMNGLANPDLIEVAQELRVPAEGLPSKDPPATPQADTPGCRDIAAEVSAYSSTPDQTWGNPYITASGSHVGHGTVAGPRWIPFGTRVYIPGYGWGTIEDRGGAIYGNRFDVWMPARWDALVWGRQEITITICDG